MAPEPRLKDVDRLARGLRQRHAHHDRGKRIVRPPLCRAFSQPHVERVAIQTNLSGRLGWTERCARERRAAPANREQRLMRDRCQPPLGRSAVLIMAS